MPTFFDKLYKLSKLYTCLQIFQVLEGPVPAWVNTLATFVQLAASASNPFIYGIFRNEFRRAFREQYRKLLHRMRCSYKPQQWRKKESNSAVTVLAYNRTAKPKESPISIPEPSPSFIAEVDEKLCVDTKKVRVSGHKLFSNGRITPSLSADKISLDSKTNHMYDEKLFINERITPSTSTPSILPDVTDERLM